MLTIQAKGLGRYRIEDQSSGFVLNFLNPAGLAYHLSKVLKMKKTEQAAVMRELSTAGKCHIQRAA